MTSTYALTTSAKNGYSKKQSRRTFGRAVSPVASPRSSSEYRGASFSLASGSAGSSPSFGFGGYVNSGMAYLFEILVRTPLSCLTASSPVYLPPTSPSFFYAAGYLFWISFNKSSIFFIINSY